MKRTKNKIWMAVLAVGVAMMGMMMTSCAKVDDPVEELDGEPGAGAGGNKKDGNWTYRISGNDVMLTGYLGNDKATLTTLDIPLKVDGKYVTYIVTPYGVNFSDFKKLEILNFDEDSRIDEMPGVKWCSTLKQINNGKTSNQLPKYMRTVRSYIFEETAIDSLNFNKVSSIGDLVFRNCDNLESVEIPTEVVSLGEQAFAYIPSKCTVTLNDSLNKLTWQSVSSSPNIIVKCKDGAMGWCGDGGDSPQDFLYWKVLLTNDSLHIDCAQQGVDNFPAENRVIKTKRWNDYMTGIGKSIKGIKLSQVYALGKEEFKGLEGVSTVELNDGLTSIGESAFEDCTSLKNITIPASVTNIGAKAFAGCTELNTVTIMGNPTIADDAIPANVTVTYVKDE